MFRIFLLVFSPLLSLFIFTLGSGLLTTLVALKLHDIGSGSLMIGSMAGAYYAGLALGSFRIERFIVRVGHIRAFAAFASSLAVIAILHGLWVEAWFWLLLRLAGGFATAGLFIVIESWLLSMANIDIRGRVLALYMVALYGAQAGGQFFIKFADHSILVPFAIAAMLSSLSVIPLAMTYVSSPKVDEPSTLSLKKLYQTSASGVIGCFSSGLILGAVYGLMPIFLVKASSGSGEIAVFMSLIIFGGMALQYPVGRLSDIIERRSVLILICVLTILTSLALIFGAQFWWLSALMLFLFGGFVFTMYPLSISHACDSLAHKDIVAGTQGLLLAYSVGATLGPLFAPEFMQRFGPSGLLIYFVVVSSLLCIFFIWRRTAKAAAPREENFISVPQTTPVLSELDPRGDGQ